MVNKKILPVRDFKLAIIYATALMPLFWVAGHPIDEWAVTIAVLYVSLWLSREIVVYLVVLVLTLLIGYGKKVLQNLGGEAPERQRTRPNFLSRLFLRAALLLVFSSVVGVSLSIGIPVASLFGLTPLPPYFNWIAWALLFVGVTGLSLIFGITALVFAAVDTIHENSGARGHRFYTISEEVASAVGK